jgi:hypothetical protein
MSDMLFLLYVVLLILFFDYFFSVLTKESHGTSCRKLARTSPAN